MVANAKLVRIQLMHTDPAKMIATELRLDWDNDRHQAVLMRSTNAFDIIDALEKTLTQLRAEMRNGKI